MKQNRLMDNTLLLLQMFFLFIILSITHTIADDQVYKLIPITTPILQEELFEGRLYHKVWTTVHYIDINDLSKDEDELSTYFFGLVDKCNKVEGCSHKNSLHSMTARYYKIKDKLDSLITLSKHRNKRGLINIVGSVSKFLFGTMSADDAETINRQIDEVYNTTSNIARLVNNQTIIIRHTLRQFEKFTELHNKHLVNLEEIVKNGTSSIIRNTFNDHLMEYVTDLELRFDDFLESVNLVLKSINDGKLGVV